MILKNPQLSLRSNSDKFLIGKSSNFGCWDMQSRVWVMNLTLGMYQNSQTQEDHIWMENSNTVTNYVRPTKFTSLADQCVYWDMTKDTFSDVGCSTSGFAILCTLITGDAWLTWYFGSDLVSSLLWNWILLVLWLWHPYWSNNCMNLFLLLMVTLFQRSLALNLQTHLIWLNTYSNLFILCIRETNNIGRDDPRSYYKTPSDFYLRFTNAFIFTNNFR